MAISGNWALHLQQFGGKGVVIDNVLGHKAGFLSHFRVIQEVVALADGLDCGRTIDRIRSHMTVAM